MNKPAAMESFECRGEDGLEWAQQWGLATGLENFRKVARKQALPAALEYLTVR